MAKALRIPAKDLMDGDTLQKSTRYGRKLRGKVVIGTRTEQLIFLQSPSLPDEDAAFQSHEMVDVLREAP